jgi:hypothetical protein
MTLPQLTYSSAFKMINKSVDLLQTEDDYVFFEQAIRGGMCFVNKHFCIDGDGTELAYVDANNLYGEALSMKLPTQGLKWITPEKYNVIDWLTVDTESDNGYWLEVDLDYPSDIHDATADLPFAPFNKKIEYEMMSEFMHDAYDSLHKIRGKKEYQPESKLLLTQEAKYFYKIHFKLLKFYLQHGMKIIKIQSNGVC